MSDVQKISIAVSAEQLRAVREAVESGAYASTSEVIRDALRGWQLREPLRKAEVERLRKAWQDGLDGGPMEPYDLDDILAEADGYLADSRATRKIA